MRGAIESAAPCLPGVRSVLNGKVEFVEFKIDRPRAFRRTLPLSSALWLKSRPEFLFGAPGARQVYFFSAPEASQDDLKAHLGSDVVSRRLRKAKCRITQRFHTSGPLMLEK